MELKTKWCSSLVKVFPAQEPESEPFNSGTALRGEIFSFQLAYIPWIFTVRKSESKLNPN